LDVPMEDMKTTSSTPIHSIIKSIAYPGIVFEKLKDFDAFKNVCRTPGFLKGVKSYKEMEYFDHKK